jgi:hypothetical protein
VGFKGKHTSLALLYSNIISHPKLLQRILLSELHISGIFFSSKSSQTTAVMAQIAQLGLRASQFLWTLLITALVGNVIATAFAGNQSSINYAIFVAVFSWLVLLFGFVAAWMDMSNIILTALDALAAVFTFIAGVVLAAKLGVHSCGNIDYIRHNSLTNGSPNMSKRCHELQASTAFFWFLFASFVGSLVLGFLSGGSSMSMRRPGIGRKGPSMSQV